MKKLQKIIAMVLATMCVCTCFAACGGGGGEAIDHSKKQLYIANFNGGMGDAWLTELEKRFEEANAERTFSDGKVGVQIIVDNAKIVGTTAMTSVLSSRDHVFFYEDVSYTEYLSNNIMLDITDMVEQTLTQYGETRSIADKLSAERRESLKIGGKYYAVPHYDGYNGITVDIDLMDAKKLFLGKDGEFLYKSTDANAGLLSNGPDGIAGTYDDGLPATYEEFFGLCNAMKLRSVDPIAWSGQHQWYVSTMLGALVVDDMGLEQATLQYTFDGGETDIITSFNQDGTYNTTKKQITIDKGYEVFKQPGYYNALRFIDKIIDSGWYTANSYVNAFSNIDVQDDFLLSSKEYTMRPIGMLVEGNWWESEATTTFNQMEDLYDKAGKLERRLRFIPFPKSSADKVGEGVTLLENNNSYAFIRSNIEKTSGAEVKQLALDFLQFANTDVSLREYNVITNAPKGLNYTLTSGDLSQMSYFGKSIYELRSAETTKILYPPMSDIWSQNRTVFNLINRLSYGDYSNPSKAFKDNPTLTAKDYFNGLASSWENKWATSFGKYFK